MFLPSSQIYSYDLSLSTLETAGFLYREYIPYQSICAN